MKKKRQQDAEDLVALFCQRVSKLTGIELARTTMILNRVIEARPEELRKIKVASDKMYPGVRS